jgi:hypothetical protein
MLYETWPLKKAGKHRAKVAIFLLKAYPDSNALDGEFVECPNPNHLMKATTNTEKLKIKRLVTTPREQNRVSWFFFCCQFTPPIKIGWNYHSTGQRRKAGKRWERRRTLRLNAESSAHALIF